MVSLIERGLFKYSVTIDKQVEWLRWQEIASWCRATFETNEELYPTRWSQALPGSPPINDPEFSTWLFVNKEDALLFELTWGYE